jgi:hypothetical protein
LRSCLINALIFSYLNQTEIVMTTANQDSDYQIEKWGGRIEVYVGPSWGHYSPAKARELALDLLKAAGPLKVDSGFLDRLDNVVDKISRGTHGVVSVDDA